MDFFPQDATLRLRNGEIVKKMIQKINIVID